MYLIWVGVFVVMVIIEALSMQLTTVWCAIASLVLIPLSFTGMSSGLQIIVFFVLSILLLVFIRRFAVKKLKTGAGKTNIDNLIGQNVKVISPVSTFQKGECETKNGVIWSAAAQDGSDIEKDAVCVITGIEGNTLIIRKK